MVKEAKRWREGMGHRAVVEQGRGIEDLKRGDDLDVADVAIATLACLP